MAYLCFFLFARDLVKEKMEAVLAEFFSGMEIDRKVGAWVLDF